MDVVVIFRLDSILHLKAYVEGTCELNLTLKCSHRYREDASEYSSSASFRRIFTRNQ